MALRKAPLPRATRSSNQGFWFLLVGTMACGPSLKSVHEGTVRFEHCNRLDLDEKVRKQECGRCWNTWLNEYTYGQPRDRIDYARRRAKALANGDEGARPVLRVEERDPEDRQFYLVVPGPTSVRAPPPPVATVVRSNDGDAGALAKSSAEAPPAESCADDCRSVWESCCAKGGGAHAPGHSGARAGSGNGPRKAEIAPPSGAGGKPNGNGNGCSACRTEYSTCMKRCFE